MCMEQGHWAEQQLLLFLQGSSGPSGQALLPFQVGEIWGGVRPWEGSMFPVGGSLCQPENKVFCLVWRPQCSAPMILLDLPWPSSPIYQVDRASTMCQALFQALGIL